MRLWKLPGKSSDMKRGTARKVRPAFVCMWPGVPLAIVTMPGEVFCGIGLAIKASSRFPFTWVSSLANGSCGYVPTAAALDPEKGGGYETRLTSGTCTTPDTADRLVEKSLEMISRLEPESVPVGPQIAPVDKVWDYGNNLPELE